MWLILLRAASAPLTRAVGTPKLNKDALADDGPFEALVFGSKKLREKLKSELDSTEHGIYI